MNSFVLFVLVVLFQQQQQLVESKKKKSSYTFDSLLSGLDGDEKEMFREELEKEVKKFRKSKF